jgi:hypothetical protein
MYTKGLVQLLRALCIAGQSGVVHIEPVQQGAQGPWFAQLLLLKGDVDSCQIRSKRDNRVLLSDVEALSRLTNAGPLLWSLEESSQSTMPSRSPLAVPSADDSNLLSDLHGSPEPLRRFDLGTQGGTSMPSKLPPTQMEPSMKRMPKRTNESDRAATLSWPREYRQVFALVDGRRTPAEIASLLHWSPERVVWMLSDLQSRGLVEL